MVRVTDDLPGPWLSQDDEHRLAVRFGRDLRRWLDHGAHRTAQLAERWGVEQLGQPRAGGTSVLIDGRRGSTRVVLKVTPERGIGRAEGAALRLWEASPHVVDVLAEDDEEGALLLAGVEPGASLAQTGWTLLDVVPIVSDLFRRRGLPDGSFPSVEARVGFLIQLSRARLHRLPAGSNVVDLDLNAVHRRAVTLAQSFRGQPHLVHGDLHPGNVLRSATDGVVAIDPRPCVGDPHFDLADWLLGPATPDDVDVRRRAEELGRLVPGVEPGRAYDWAVALAPVIAYSVGTDPSATAQARASQLAALWR
jgi:streptomycin 6-kinase